ncbi:MAG: ribose 5-phosphate isomerase B [Aquificae bacterium]|nr:ribose 5-phosphate isomerase B [Aquificota bacterium]
MKIAIGSDHAGYDYKENIKNHLISLGHEVIDKGTYSKESTDYPIYAKAVAEEVACKKADRGIVICGTGIGVSITANKVSGIRAALCTNEFMARLSRQHNDANVIAVGARVIGLEHAIAIIETFLNTSFEGGRHERRIHLIEDIKNLKC